MYHAEVSPYLASSDMEMPKVGLRVALDQIHPLVIEVVVVADGLK